MSSKVKDRLKTECIHDKWFVLSALNDELRWEPGRSSRAYTCMLFTKVKET